MPRKQLQTATLEPRVVQGVLKVGRQSNPNKVAGAIAGVLRENPGKPVAVQTVGAGALNQAIKAIAIARGYLASKGIDPWCFPSFADVVIDGRVKTAIRLNIMDVSA